MARAAQLVLLMLVAASASYALTALSPLQESMRTNLSLSDNQMALLQGPTRALPLLLLALPIGFLIDRLSRLRVIQLFLALNIAAGLIVSSTAEFQTVFAARCVVGLAAPSISMAAISIIADLYPPSQRGRANTVIGLGQAGGAAAAFAFGGALLAMFAQRSDSWRWAMIGLTAPIMAILLFTLILREPPRTSVAIAKPSAQATLAELWAFRKIITPLLGGDIMVGLVDMAALTWAAPTFERNYLASPARVGALIAGALLLSGLVGPVAGGFIADFCQRTGGPRRVLAVLSALMILSVPTGLFAVAPEEISATLLLAAFITVGNAIGAMTTTLGNNVVPNELRGTLMATSIAVSAPISLGLAPLTVSYLSGALGGPTSIGHALAIVCASISLVGAAVFMLARGHFASDRHIAQEA